MHSPKRKHNLSVGDTLNVYIIKEIKLKPEQYLLECSNCGATYWRTRKQVVDAISRAAAKCSKCRKKVNVKQKQINEGHLSNIQAEWLRRAWC